MDVAAWHVLRWDARVGDAYTINGNRRVRVGETMETAGRVVLYGQGYHACPLLYDALFYAPPVERPVIQRCVLRDPAFSLHRIIGVAAARRCDALLGEQQTWNVLKSFMRLVVGEMVGMVAVDPLVYDYVMEGKGDRLEARQVHRARDYPYAGQSHYAHRAVYYALTWEESLRPAYHIRFGLERAALAHAYARQGGRDKGLTSLGQVFLREEMLRLNGILEAAAQAEISRLTAAAVEW